MGWGGITAPAYVAGEGEVSQARRGGGRIAKGGGESDREEGKKKGEGEEGARGRRARVVAKQMGAARQSITTSAYVKFKKGACL